MQPCLMFCLSSCSENETIGKKSPTNSPDFSSTGVLLGLLCLLAFIERLCTLMWSFIRFYRIPPFSIRVLFLGWLRSMFGLVSLILTCHLLIVLGVGGGINPTLPSLWPPSPTRASDAFHIDLDPGLSHCSGWIPLPHLRYPQPTRPG